MSTLVTSSKQVLQNVDRFGAELKGSPDLQNRLGYARAWYAHRANNRTWLFAPSKFCGYQGMTAAEYLNDDPRDGRRTERQLAQWFTEVPEDDALHEELSDALTSFLAGYGKAPSTKMRINVIADVYEDHLSAGDPSHEQTVADLIIAVAKRLPQAERNRVRASL